MAISLRFAAGGTVSGIEESALGALTKLDQVMPPRLRGRVQALGESTDSLGGAGEVDVGTLTAMAHACRDRLRIRCRYRRRDGQSQQRTVEPVRMVAAGWRWYLMAFDLDRQDWRSFRLDRMDQVEVTTFRFVPRDHPDPLQYIQASIAEAPYEHLARVRLRADVEELRRDIPPPDWLSVCAASPSRAALSPEEGCVTPTRVTRRGSGGSRAPCASAAAAAWRRRRSDSSPPPDRGR